MARVAGRQVCVIERSCPVVRFMGVVLEHRAKKWEPVFCEKRCGSEQSASRKKWEPVFCEKRCAMCAPFLVIPAQAGIQLFALCLQAQSSELDPRLRGDDE
jgi:hypothetical protein